MPIDFLRAALDLLARDEDPKSFKLAPIDFKSLGVRQLGSIYEGLLEFKLLVANEKLAIVKEKNREVYRPFKELSETERERAEREQRVIAKGRGYLENDRRGAQGDRLILHAGPHRRLYRRAGRRPGREGKVRRPPPDAPQGAGMASRSNQERARHRRES